MNKLEVSYQTCMLLLFFFFIRICQKSWSGFFFMSFIPLLRSKLLLLKNFRNWATNKIACAPSKDFDQPVYLLIMSLLNIHVGLGEKKEKKKKKKEQ